MSGRHGPDAADGGVGSRAPLVVMLAVLAPLLVASVVGLRTGPVATALAGAFVVGVLLVYLFLPDLLGRRAAVRARDGALG